MAKALFYWVGQFGFSVRWYEKTQTNFVGQPNIGGERDKTISVLQRKSFLTLTSVGIE